MVQAAKAHWVTRDTLGWTGADPEAIYRLYYSATGEIAARLSTPIQDVPSIPLSVDQNGMPQSVVEKFPFLKHATALRISDPDLVQVRRLLKGELLVAQIDDTGIVDETPLQ